MTALAPSPQARMQQDPSAKHIHLFASAVKDCRITRLSGEDASTDSDTWRDLESLVFPWECKYPRIDKWLNTKVRPGVESNRRRVFVGYHMGEPAVAAVVKVGETSKFCHLSVSPALQQRNVGELFFAVMAMSVRAESKSLRFTLPEGLWETQRSFFESFAFTSAKPNDRQYRLFERELFCEAPFTQVWPTVIQKVAKLRQSVSIDGVGWDQDLVMSVHPEYAERILAGTKTVEIRRKFSTARVPATCVLYATSPIQKVVGQVDIVRATRLDPQQAWIRFGQRADCTQREMDTYASGTDQVCALELKNPVRFPNAIALSTIRTWINRAIKPPQSHSLISDGSGWECAMPVIAMLQSLNRYPSS